MEKFYLEEPSMERKEEALEYIKEILDNNKSETDGTNKLKYYIDDYEDWVMKVENDEKIIPSEDSVPAKTYFFVRKSDNRIIGMTHIRLTLNKMLEDIGGHIGYNIRPSERHKGYNKIQLYLALFECKKNGLGIIMLDCLKDNLGSSKTITSLGGYLVKEEEKTLHGEKVTIQDYNINVDESLEKYKDIYAKYISNQNIK